MRRDLKPAVTMILALTFTGPALASVACNAHQVPTKYNGVFPWKAGIGIGFKKKLAVDADGAPNSYQTDGNGLSYTCDGLVAIIDGKKSTPDTDPDHWQANCKAGWKQARESGDYANLSIFGFQTDAHNVPLVQKAGDPLPDLGFISTTTMPVPEGPEGTQRHWVDATAIPYIVLSGAFTSAFGISQGDVAVVYRPSTGKMAFGIYADGGKLGEASVRLHQDLGSDPMMTLHGVARAKRGIDDPVVTIVFPGRKTHAILDVEKWRAEIETVGNQALGEWGGIERVKACAE